MKANRFNRITAVTLTIVMTFVFCVFTISVMAQNTGKTSDTLENERIARIVDPNTNVEEFRTEMKSYLNDFANALSNFEAIPAVREQYEKNGINPIVALERARANMDKIPAEDLVRMKEAYAQYPNWRQAPRTIYEISQKVVNKTYTRDTKGKKPGDITPNVIIPDACPDISAVPSYTDIAILRGAIVLAEGIMEALPTDLLSIIGRLPAIVAFSGAQGGLIAVETLRGQYEFCISPTTEDVQNIVTEAKDEILANADANRTTITTAVSNAQTTIVNNDNTNKNTIINNDNTNKDTIVTNDNNNKTTIVNNDNANTLTLTNLINATRVEILNTVKDSKEESNNLLLRTQIEADLASTDGSTFVALYETPSNVCLPSLNQRGLPQIGALSNPVQCGLLDLVRSIVRDTIANVNTSSTAASFFAQGDTQRAAGQYKAAYTSYRKAYKAASM
jgi:hypothetical protein